MKKVVIDTSVVVAVLLDEPHKAQLIELTDGCELIAPPSLHWEVGNAMSSLLKRKLLSRRSASKALKVYTEIPIQFSDISLSDALSLCSELKIYAYDAYMISCAQKHRCPLISLDSGLVHAGKSAGVRFVEVK